MNKNKNIYIIRTKSFKPFRTRKMGHGISEFSQNNGNNMMNNQIDMPNENRENRNIDME